MQLDAATQMWRWGVAPDGTPFPSFEAHSQATSERLERAVADLRRALRGTPTDPFVHERLGWAHGLLGLVQPARGAAARATAIAHLERASLLAPDNPFLYRSRAVLGLTAPESLLPDVLRAGAAGVIPGGESFDRFVRIYEAMRRGDEAVAESAYREVLPLIVFLEESIDHLVTYGKQVLGRRLGIDPGNAPLPATVCTPFGVAAANRFADALSPL